MERDTREHYHRPASTTGTLREAFNRDNLHEIRRNAEHIGRSLNGLIQDKKCGGASFQSRNYAKTCGNSLLLAFIERKVIHV